ncbi:peptidoglycan recognition family protein [Ornithinimicrobium sp. LYQ92]|uniref:peptidoglycan recognition protein family protein n=1 Tax=Serinicoccus sp. LYQ92 TaxID=3378798 RepID=UPI003851ADCA
MASKALINVVMRPNWGSAYGLGWRIRDLPATTAWLHHAVTNNLPANATTARERQEMRLIDRIGYDRFKYADTGWTRPAGAGISYSYVVFPSGRAYQGHGINRASSHTAGYNTYGLGIAVPGNTDIQDLTDQQVDAIARLLVQLKREGALVNARLNGGHRDTGFSTSCPGNKAYARIGEINALAARYEKGHVTTPVTPPTPAPQPPPSVPITTEARTFQRGYNALYGKTLAEDGAFGPLSQAAAGTYAEDYGFTGGTTTPSKSLLAHLEDSMTMLDEMRKLRQAVEAKPTAKQIAEYPYPDPVTGEVSQLGAYPAFGNRRAAANTVLLQQVLKALQGQQMDPTVVGTAMADALREDVLQAVKDSGAGASAEDIAQLLGARLSSAATNTPEAV